MLRGGGRKRERGLGCFMSYAARVMRGLIIDYMRNRQTEKRGELFVITSLSNKTPENPPPNAS